MPVAALGAFAAILPGADGERILGAVAGTDALPAALRRRMTPFERGLARCVAGLSPPDAAEDIVLCSRYGNMAIAVDLLRRLSERDLLSPALFSMSVHNAAAGCASQITGNRGGHTAVAAGPRTLAAGLTEAYVRLATGARSVLLAFAERALPDVYAGFDPPGAADLYLAVRVSAPAGAGPLATLADGAAGVLALAEALASGARRICWRP
jgi:hypothetical protein